jgi:predicted ATPase
VAGSLYFGTIIHLARREVGRAGELAEALLRHCDEQGFALLYAAGLILHGQCLAQHGQVEEGLRQMRQGMADWQVTGAVSHRPYHLALLAEALGRAGEVEPAPVALGEALSIARSTGERFWEVELHRLRGGMLLTQAAADPSAEGAAEASFREALKVARRQRAMSLELRAAVGLSRLYQRQGRPVEAQPLLAATYDWFTEGFESPDLREAKALLDELAS